MTHIIDNNLYDLTNFIHPGGKQLLNISRGMDITTVFHSNHFDSVIIKNTILAKYFVKKVQVCNTNPIISQEYEDMKQIASNIIIQKKIHIRQLNKLYDFICITSFFINLCLIVMVYMFPLNSLIATPSVVVINMLKIIIGGYGHQCIHRNSMFNFSLTLGGFVSNRWILEHTFKHHSITNYNEDPDLIRMQKIFKVPFSLLRFIISSIYVGISIYVKFLKEISVLSFMDIFAIFVLYAEVFVSVKSNNLALHLLSRVLVGSLFIVFDYNNHYSCNIKLNNISSIYHENQILQSQDVVITGNDFIDIFFGFGLNFQTIHHLFPKLTNMELIMIKKEIYKNKKINIISFSDAIYNCIFYFN